MFYTESQLFTNLLLPYDIYNNVTKPHPLLNAKKNSTIYLLDSPIVT